MLPLPPATLPTMFMALSKVGEYLMTLWVSLIDRDRRQRPFTRFARYRQHRSMYRMLNRSAADDAQMSALTLLQHEVGDQV
jgi:hypothetical protein